MFGDKPIKRFWKFLTDSQSIIFCILEELKIQKVNDKPSKLIVQMYYGVVVMLGCLRGIQAFPGKNYND